MAEVKISALGSATSLAGTEAVPVVQTGVTRKTTTGQIAALLQPAIDVVSQALSVEQNARAFDINRLSNQISNIVSAGDGAISVTSGELASVAASVNLHINAVSLNLEVEIADRKSMICVVSARVSAGTSVRGLQSIVNGLSDRISGVAAGAVSVTSNELSAAAAALSNRISITSALASTIELHASAASDAATSANLHANAASAAATSVLAYICAVSATSNATSTRGLQSIVNQLSNRVSAAVAGIASVTSNELSAAAAALSNRISITSALASAAEVHASTACAFASVADLHASTASLAATSVLNFVNARSVRNQVGNSVKGVQSVIDTLSSRVASAMNNLSVTSNDLSAAVKVSTKSGATSVQGLQSVVNQISNRISAAVAGVVSTTSDELSIALAAVSNRISVASAVASAADVKASTASAAASVADLHASTASDAATSVNARANSIVAYICAVSCKSATTSVRGLQSIIQQLSAHINSLSVAPIGVSVTSTELSAAVGVSVRSGAGSIKGLQSVVNTLSTKIANVVAGTASATSVELLSVDNRVSIEINNRISADNVISNRVSLVSQALSIEIARAISVETQFSNLLSVAAINTASVLLGFSNQISNVNLGLNALIVAHNTLSNRVSANSATGGGGAASVTSNVLSTRISVATSVVRLCSVRNSAGVSVQGLQSALNALSGKAGGGGGSGSVTSARVNSISAGVSSLQGAMAVVSAAVTNLSNVVSARILSINALSTAVCAIELHASTASGAATSADAHAQNASALMDARATSIELRLSTLSAAFSVLASAVSNALSAGDVKSIKIADLSNRHSVVSQWKSVVSTNYGLPEKHLNNTTATISASGLTKISGLSATLVSTATYEINAVLIHSHSTQGTNGFGFGVSLTGSPVAAAGVWRGFVSVVAPGVGNVTENIGYFNQAGFGSITYSATPTASATVYRTELNLHVINMTTDGTIQLKARTSAATVGAIDIRPGSFIRAVRIN